MSRYGKEEVLEYHKGGKVGVRLPKPLATKDDLCLAYTPGVAHAVKAIAVIPDETVEQISKEEQVEIKYGCIGNELEIWSIRVPPFE